MIPDFTIGNNFRTSQYEAKLSLLGKDFSLVVSTGINRRKMGKTQGEQGETRKKMCGGFSKEGQASVLTMVIMNLCVCICIFIYNF